MTGSVAWMSSRRRLTLVAASVAIMVLLPDGMRAAVAGAAATTIDELTPLKAAVLGLVEGVTEFLPISSTGHLLVTQRLMDVGTTDATKAAADAYAIAIQSGAILAVVLLYWRRLWSMVEVCDRSRMWMPFRAPKIYGFMRGFQRWVWWPKCAPASINWFIVTTGAAIVVSFPVLPLES